LGGGITQNHDLEECNQRIVDFSTQLEQANADVKKRKRIGELQSQEALLSSGCEQIESEIAMVDQFVRAKAEILEKTINPYFTACQWRFFKNGLGEPEECCETVKDGVPYNSMNNAARINAGLNVCSVLSEHRYGGSTMPCFIDNAESVTEIFSTSAQQIRLVVFPGDKTMRIVQDIDGVLGEVLTPRGAILRPINGKEQS